MSENHLIIGRDATCDFVIFDPERRVSRKHAEITISGSRFFIKDLKSTNGVYINGVRIQPNKPHLFNMKDRITLSSSYVLNLFDLLQTEDDETLFAADHPGSGKKPAPHNLSTDKGKSIYRKNNKTVVFDRDKTTISELLEIDDTEFKIIGRSQSANYRINDSNVSNEHCKIRMISNILIEIIDLGSTNGTYADKTKLIPNKKYQFASSVVIRIGQKHVLNLNNLFSDIQILDKKMLPARQSPNQSPVNTEATSKEMKDFAELELVWEEYVKRQNEAQNAPMSYGIAGTILGAAIGVFTGGIGLLAGGAGGIIGRYLGQQESNEIRQDMTFESAFLQIYCCPRCKESFQKKPWITIRDCFKCKVKFRK